MESCKSVTILSGDILQARIQSSHPSWGQCEVADDSLLAFGCWIQHWGIVSDYSYPLWYGVLVEQALLRIVFVGAR